MRKSPLAYSIENNLINSFNIDFALPVMHNQLMSSVIKTESPVVFPPAECVGMG